MRIWETERPCRLAVFVFGGLFPLGRCASARNSCRPLLARTCWRKPSRAMCGKTVEFVLVHLAFGYIVPLSFFTTTPSRGCQAAPDPFFIHNHTTHGSSVSCSRRSGSARLLSGELVRYYAPSSRSYWSSSCVWWRTRFSRSSGSSRRGECNLLCQLYNVQLYHCSSDALQGWIVQYLFHFSLLWSRGLRRGPNTDGRYS